MSKADELRALPWGVNRIGKIYAAGVHAEMPNGNWVRAVGVPYPGGRIRAAWWVLTGRAHALRWPKAGELEQALSQSEPT